MECGKCYSKVTELLSYKYTEHYFVSLLYRIFATRSKEVQKQLYSNNVLLHQILFSSLPVAGFHIPGVVTAAAVVVTVTVVATIIADATAAVTVSPGTIQQRPYCLFSQI